MEWGGGGGGGVEGGTLGWESLWVVGTVTDVQLSNW